MVVTPKIIHNPYPSHNFCQCCEQSAATSLLHCRDLAQHRPNLSWVGHGHRALSRDLACWQEPGPGGGFLMIALLDDRRLSRGHTHTHNY